MLRIVDCFLKIFHKVWTNTTKLVLTKLVNHPEIKDSTRSQKTVVRNGLMTKNASLASVAKSIHISENSERICIKNKTHANVLLLF